MIGTPTVSSAWVLCYHLLVLAIIAAFAIYDVYRKRVPDKALVFCIPIALASPFICSPYEGAIPMCIVQSVLGALTGFVILLAAAMASKGGNGIGGGDIKLAAVLGFIYGPYGIIGTLLIASLLAMPAGIWRKRKSGGQTLRLAFVPFMAVGCLVNVIMKIIV